MKKLLSILVLLAALPVMAGVPYVVNLGGSGTNTTLQNPTFTSLTNISITDAKGRQTTTIGTNDTTGANYQVWTLSPNSSGLNAGIKVVETNGTVAYMLYESNHNPPMTGRDGEWAFLSGSIAFITHRVQFGNTFGGPQVIEFTFYQVDVDTNAWRSMPMVFQPLYYSNTTAYIAGANTLYSGDQYSPAIQCNPAGSQSNAVFGFYSKFNNGAGDGTIPIAGNIQQHGLYVGSQPGVSFTGRTTNDGFAGITTNIIIGSNIIQVHNGYQVGYGPIDSDSGSFLARAAAVGFVSNTETNRIISFVASGKAHGWWTNLVAFYPNIGTNFAQHSYNLISNSFNITTNSAFVANCTHTVAGVKGNGSTGDADTGFIPGTHGGGTSPFQLTNSSVFIFITNCASASAIIGAWDDNFRCGLTRDNSSPTNNFQVNGWNNPNGSSGNTPLGNFNDYLMGGVGNSAFNINANGFTWRSGSGSGQTGLSTGHLSILSRSPNNDFNDQYNSGSYMSAGFGGGWTQAKWNTFLTDWQAFEAGRGQTNSLDVAVQAGPQNIATNTASPTVTTNVLVLATPYTTPPQRCQVLVTLAFNDSTTGTPLAKVVTTEPNGSGTSLVDVQTLMPEIGGLSVGTPITNTFNLGVFGPGTVITVTDSSLGTAATVTLVRSKLSQL